MTRRPECQVNGWDIVRLLQITLRSAQVRRISWVRGVRPARERCEWPPHDTAPGRPPCRGPAGAFWLIANPRDEGNVDASAGDCASPCAMNSSARERAASKHLQCHYTIRVSRSAARTARAV